RLSPPAPPSSEAARANLRRDCRGKTDADRIVGEAKMPSKDQETLASLEARHGDKMIEIKIRFWTNDLADAPGKIIPKHARTSGVIRMERNESHGIVPGKPLPFRSLLDVGAAIE